MHAFNLEKLKRTLLNIRTVWLRTKTNKQRIVLSFSVLNSVPIPTAHMLSSSDIKDSTGWKNPLQTLINSLHPPVKHGDHLFPSFKGET